MEASGHKRGAKAGSRPARRFEWLLEDLVEQPSFVMRPMFGCHACYLHGRLVLVLASRTEDPWNGALIPTYREHHRPLCRDYPPLVPHPVLGKWLYLSANSEAFEKTALALVERIIGDDVRIGVIADKARKAEDAEGNDGS